MIKMFTSQLTKAVCVVIAIFSISSIDAQSTEPTCPTTEINFNDYTVEIVPTRPDGGFEIQEGGTIIHLTGNSWRQIPFDYEVTENTVIEFEFRSDQRGNRHGLGFYNTSTTFGDNLVHFFQIYGITGGFGLIYSYNNYSGTEWLTYRIPVGQFYQGSFDQLAFMNSNHQSGSNGNSYFRNVVISEQLTGSCTLPNGNPGLYGDCQCVPLTACPAINFNNYAVLPYGISGNQDAGQYEVQDAGQTLMIVENAWKSIMFNYTVTENTILDFDFKSTAEGEIHGIGLHTDDNQISNRTFQLFGTQLNFGLQTYNDYTLEDGWKTYSIPIGTFPNNTGDRSRLFFVGDDDDEPIDANSFFRSVKVYEDGTCYPDCVPPSFSCAAPIKAIADENGEAEVNFAAMAEGTDLTITYQYLMQPITSPATFSTGVHHIIATATNECGAAVSDCITITVLNCRDNDASQGYGLIPGFGPWEFDHTENAGNFIATSTNNGDGDSNNDGDIDTDDAAFGLFANNGGVASMTRPFINQFIAGESFSVDFDNGWINDGSTVGIALQNASDENLIEFYFIGGESDYKLNAADGETGTGIGFTDQGLSLKFSKKNGGIVDVDITNLGTGVTTSYTQTLSSPAAGQSIAQLRFFNANAGSGGTNDAFINSLSLCQSFVDADGDGYGVDIDCDDNDPEVNPGAEEVYFDGIDNDCNPETPDENSGLFESYLILNEEFYDLQADTDLTDFTGEIGTFTCDAPLVLSGAENKTFKCAQHGEGDILNGKLFYRIYAQGDAAGSFAELNLGFGSDDNEVFGCQNQTWQTIDADVNLTDGLSPGTYVIEVYTTADYTFTGGAGTHEADNDGAYYVATIQIVDETAPNVLTQNIIVQLDADGMATIDADDIDNGSTDACGIDTRTLDITSFDCDDVNNPVTVELTVTDVNGNVSTADATVTVQDIIAPVAIAQDIIVQLDALGSGSATAEEVNDGSNDACGIATLALSQTAFDCSHVGLNDVTLTVTDVNGNVSTALAVVTVEDNVAPVAIAQNVTVQLDNSGFGFTTAEAVDIGSSDACGIATLVLNQTDFDCAHIGTNEVILTVIDENENESTAEAVVTVLAPLEEAEAIVTSTVVPNSSDNIVIFDDAPASLNLPDATTLTASIAPSTYSAATYQWFVRDLPDGTFTALVGEDQADLSIESSGDFHREYLVEITTASACFADASVIVFSVSTSCKGPDKVLVCHVPPGNPNNAKNICVNQNAVEALLANSDSYIGSCEFDYKMNEVVPLQVNIYPNPTRSNFNFSLEGGSIKAELIQMFDMQGRLIQSIRVAEYESSLLMEIEMSMHENGIYILNVYGNSQIISTKKLVKSN